MSKEDVDDLDFDELTFGGDDNNTKIIKTPQKEPELVPHHVA
jgi:hypothetical protein